MKRKTAMTRRKKDDSSNEKVRMEKRVHHAFEPGISSISPENLRNQGLIGGAE
jgi:hypothetical protein